MRVLTVQGTVRHHPPMRVEKLAFLLTFFEKFFVHVLHVLDSNAKNKLQKENADGICTHEKFLLLFLLQKLDNAGQQLKKNEKKFVQKSTK